MLSEKEQLITIIKNLPNDASLEDILNTFQFKNQIETGLKQLDDGKGIPHEKIIKKFDADLKKKN